MPNLNLAGSRRTRITDGIRPSVRGLLNASSLRDDNHQQFRAVQKVSSFQYFLDVFDSEFLEIWFPGKICVSTIV